MRFVRLRSYIDQLIASSKPDAIFYEEVRRHLGTDAAHIYGGIVAVITETCERLAIPYAGIPVATIKFQSTPA